MDSHPATSEAFTGQRMQNKSPPLTFDYRELFERAPFGYVLLGRFGAHLQDQQHRCGACWGGSRRG